MVEGHKIIKNIPIDEFISRISDYSMDEIILSNHTLFLIREKDRKIFKDKVIKLIVQRTNPINVGLQKNGCYAVFYNHDAGLVFRVIMDIQPSKVFIVTFYAIEKTRMPT
jgi:hypothetical protein